MLFNSVEFLFFLPLVFVLYWILERKSLKFQNFLLLVASYFFYACWDWRFLFLLFFSTGLDYYTGLKMYDAQTQFSKKFWFWLSIGVNVSFLGVFKYYNFFATSLQESLSVVGLKITPVLLDVILPVGISFYTFHGLSYVIDIYKNRIKPERNFIDYALFVSYFPLLVAGPIERATHLLPQLKLKRQFDYYQAVSGCKQIVFGLFKKIVVADNCAFFVNKIFDNPGSYSSGELFIGMIFFAFQIYGDFSGYSDIALGTSKLFGIDLLRNFNMPYFSRDIAEFWRKWHISLSSWFRDYVYIPLGGSQGSKWRQIRNVFVIFLLSGFWHGANWTFIVWGGFHGLLFLPLLLMDANRKNLNTTSYQYKDVIKILTTFLLVCIGWVFFRADTLTIAINYLVHMFTCESFAITFFYKTNANLMVSILCFTAILILVSQEFFWLKQKKETPVLSTVWSLILVFIILFMGSFKNQMDFIYFQF